MTEREAQLAIAKVLAELERSTGQFLRGISIESIEVTRLMDTRQMLHRTVRFDLQPVPGSQWETK